MTLQNREPAKPETRLLTAIKAFADHNAAQPIPRERGKADDNRPLGAMKERGARGGGWAIA